MDYPSEKTIECFNSPYRIIMLRKIGTQDVIGILKPIDSENFKINDSHELQYRRYSSILEDYHKEEISATIQLQNFTYFPYLSDLEVIILTN